MINSDSEDSFSSTTAADSGSEPSEEEEDTVSEDLPAVACAFEATSQEVEVGPANPNMNVMAEENERVTRQNVVLMEAVQRMRQSCQQPSTVQPLCGFACMPAPACGYGPSMWMPVQFAVPSQAWSPNTEYTAAQSMRMGAQTSGMAPVFNNVGASRTSVMVKNLPNNYTRGMLVEMFESEGFGGMFDFLYLPIDFKTQAALGYAFVNFTHPTAAQQFWRVFDNYSNFSVPTRKACSVSWCEPNQGLGANIDRYRNSPVMHDAVPDEYKPIILESGARVPFPPPTKAIRAPRARDCRRDNR